MKELKAYVVIPPKSSRIAPMGCDKQMCKWHHLIGNFFQKIRMLRGQPCGSARQMKASARSFALRQR